MNSKILELEVGMLLLRYGYKQVIRALASKQNYTEKEIEAEIQKLEQTAADKKSKRVRKSLVDTASKLVENCPDKSAIIIKLAGLYESKRFLPQMKDVRRFLLPMGVDSRSLKSRADSGVKVLEKLCECSLEELQSMAKIEDAGRSVFSDLSSEILGHKGSDAEKS